MGIQNYGEAIRSARILANLTQEQLCEGICESLSLSRIETGRAGVSPEIFRQLMQRAGVTWQVMPAFEDRQMFQLHLKMEDANFYLRCGALEEAFLLLQEIAKHEKYFDDGYRRQRFMAAQLWLQAESGGDYAKIVREARRALAESAQTQAKSDFPAHLLSVTEMELLLVLGRALCEMGEAGQCLEICQKLETYLCERHIFYKEKYYLQGRTAILACYAALQRQDEISAYRKQLEEIYDTCCKARVEHIVPQLLAQIGQCKICQGEKEAGIFDLKIACYAAAGLRTFFAVQLYQKACQEWNIALVDERTKRELLSIHTYPWIELPEVREKTADGQKNQEREMPYQLGDIIRDLRQEQGLTQEQLCTGLYSKAKLSKIENKSQMPGKSLSDALLSRLGILGENYYLFCSKEEFWIAENLQRCSDYCNWHTPEGDKLAAELLGVIEGRLKESDRIHQRNCMSLRAIMLPKEKRTELSYEKLINEALHCTIPNFKEENLQKYPVADEEIRLIRQWAGNLYCRGEKIRAIQLMYQMLHYFERYEYTPQQKILSYPLILTWMFSYLWQEKRYVEMLELGKFIKDPITSSQLYSMDKIYWYAAIAHGKLGQQEVAEMYGRYSCAMYRARNQLGEAEKLEKELQEEVGQFVTY